MSQKKKESDVLKPLPVRDKANALTRGLTFAEFLAASPRLGAMLRGRLREIRISPEDQDFFVQYPDVLNFVLLVNEEIPEAIAVVPVLVSITQRSPRFTLQLLRDTDDLAALARQVDEAELNRALNELALPLLYIFDEEWNLQGQWGPHPQAAESYLEAWFEAHPEYEKSAESLDSDEQALYTALLDKLTHEMRVWYNSGLNQACINEVRAVVATLLEDDNTDDDEDDE
jgi:hypothetical protein